MRIASQRVAPSAYAPSRCDCGTAFSTSRATEELNGMTMIARISAADSMPTPSGGPLNSGTLRSHSGVALELAHRRHQHEDAPEAVDDRRDRREQLGQEDQRSLQPRRRQLGDEDRDAERDRRRDEQRRAPTNRACPR